MSAGRPRKIVLQKEELERLYREAGGVRELAALLGVSSNTTQRALHRAGVAVKRKGRPRRAPGPARWLSFRRMRKLVPYRAERVPGYVWERACMTFSLEELSLLLRVPEELVADRYVGHKRPKHVSPTRGKLMDLRFGERLTQEDIAARYGTGTGTVREWMVAEGVPEVPNSQRLNGLKRRYGQSTIRGRKALGYRLEKAWAEACAEAGYGEAVR